MAASYLSPAPQYVEARRDSLTTGRYTECEAVILTPDYQPTELSKSMDVAMSVYDEAVIPYLREDFTYTKADLEYDMSAPLLAHVSVSSVANLIDEPSFPSLDALCYTH